MSGPRTVQAGRRPGLPRAQLPLLDRLGDGESDGNPSTTAAALDAFRSAVKRDIEILLNARRRRRPLPTHLQELPSSLLSYGIPDPTSGSFSVPEFRAALVAEIEATIRRFEPRLKDVAVSLLNEANDLDRMLRMKVEATLLVDPVPETISFETRVEPVSHDIIVREI